MPTPTEDDVLRLFLARTDTYAVTHLQAVRGRLYALTMQGKPYHAVVLPTSFCYYRLRYHLATAYKPTLIICYVHDTVVPLPVLSMKGSHFAHAYDLPADISDVARQRKTQRGSQVLLGMYLSGMKAAFDLMDTLPVNTRNRYLRKAKALSKRTRGKPVGLASGAAHAS